mmetsp:Transcript_15442/g.58457  ORF Transcript_15442/g.58457 Transcript_15442/m.58457 type:complete len:251 (+) Transcript_15442:4470-5222(+)
MLRCRVRVPPPQVLLQELHGLNALTTHGEVHWLELHAPGSAAAHAPGARQNGPSLPGSQSHCPPPVAEQDPRPLQASTPAEASQLQHRSPLQPPSQRHVDGATPRRAASADSTHRPFPEHVMAESHAGTMAASKATSEWIVSTDASGEAPATGAEVAHCVRLNTPIGTPGCCPGEMCTPARKLAAPSAGSESSWKLQASNRELLAVSDGCSPAKARRLLGPVASTHLSSESARSSACWGIAEPPARSAKE